jgi:predicted AAA+ superfamily ATPase
MVYRSRIVDKELKRRLSSMGAVVIEGPKACGKTETARQVARSEVLMDVDRNAQRAVDVDPALVLDGDVPRLIDEWQVAPEIWNHIRRTIDDRESSGQFILTGSAVPADDITRHTGAGRLTRLRMRPMSLFETGDATGEVSLAGLLQGTSPRAPDPGVTVPHLAAKAAIGGWPGHLRRGVDEALEANRSYLDEIRRVDIGRVDRRERDPERVGRLLTSLGRNVATYASGRTLAADAGGSDGALALTTVSGYLSALDRLMVLEDQPAWAPHLRSKSRLRKASKRHFVDPSLAVAALGATPASLLNDLEFFGFIFESMVIRDLRVFAQAADADVLQYRDNTGLEVDAVVRTRDNRWAAFEVKLGQGQADEAARSLLRFQDRVDTGKSGEPQMLGIIVATGYSYMRDDGIAVICSWRASSIRSERGSFVTFAAKGCLSPMTPRTCSAGITAAWTVSPPLKQLNQHLPVEATPSRALVSPILGFGYGGGKDGGGSV